MKPYNLAVSYLDQSSKNRISPEDLVNKTYTLTGDPRLISKAVPFPEKYGVAVEIPTGTGIFLSEFANNNLRWFARGYDISKYAVKYASRLTRINNKHIPFFNLMIIKTKIYFYTFLYTK